MARKNLISFVSLVLLQILLILLSFNFLLQEFKVFCSNQEFLSWDADLRFIKTLQLMDHLRSFEIFSFFFQLLDSPTWPVLRNLIQVILFFITGVSTNTDILITLVTSAVLLGLILHIFYYLNDKHWTAGLLFLPVWMLFFLSPPLIIYSFSAMLEIQGALLFLASVYYLYLFYQKEDSYKDKLLLLKLFLSTFALFNTKYPYGYLLLFAILIVHSSLYFEDVILFGTRYIAYFLNEFKKQYRIIAILFLALAYLLFPEFILKGKAKTYLKYSIVLLCVVDFYLYLFRQTEELLNLNFQKLTTILKWVFLPIIAFVLMHPDRFSSSSSTLAHIQSEGHMVGEVVEKNLDYYLVFLKAITTHSFSSEWIGILLLIGLFISVAYGYFIYFRKKEIGSHFFFSVFSFITILILTFFTPNHQARHIYHLLPAIAIGVLLLIAKFRISHKTFFYGFVILVSVLIMVPYTGKLTAKFSGENVCYTGKNKDDFFTPREIEKKFKNLDKNTVFFNFINPIHVNKADTELVLSKIAFENKIKILINPKNFKHNPNEDGFQEVFIIADSCEKDYLIETWFKKMHPSVKLTLREDPNLPWTYEVATKGKSFLLTPPDSKKNSIDQKISKDPKFTTGDGCLQTIRFSILP